MENENKLSLRLDETLETLTNWLNSLDAICYRPVILNYNPFSASDNLGLGELELVSVSGGTHSYVQQVKDYSIPLRNCGVQIQYDLFPLKTGVVIKLTWDKETAGAVWDLLKEIARLWPETRENILAWQASEKGQAPREKAQQEKHWQSPNAKRIRMAAEVAYSLQMKKEVWEALLAEEREAHEDAIVAWGRLVEEVQGETGETISSPSDDAGAPVGDVEGRQSPPTEDIPQGGKGGGTVTEPVTGGKYGTCRDLLFEDVKAIVTRCKDFKKRGGRVPDFYNLQNIMPGDPRSYELETLRGWLKDPKFS